MQAFRMSIVDVHVRSCGLQQSLHHCTPSEGNFWNVFTFNIDLYGFVLYCYFVTGAQAYTHRRKTLRLWMGELQ